MKHLLFALIFIPSFAVAQFNPSGVPGINPNNPAQMQAMMALMQKMQQCMEKVDQSAFSLLEQEAKQLEIKIPQLCQQGKRQQAQQMGFDFAHKVQNDAAMQQLKSCVSSNLPIPLPFDNILAELKNQHQHICSAIIP